MTKKLIGFAMIAIMLFGVFWLTGCENRGREFEVDGWTLIQFGRGSSKRGQVNILSADESLAVDGVLFVPAKIGEYGIHGFGSYDAPFAAEDYFTVPSNVERVVVSAELHVDELFWGDSGYFDTLMTKASSVKYIEFLCDTFERIKMGIPSQLLIIPDGSTHNFVTRFENRIESLNFIEKSKFMEEK